MLQAELDGLVLLAQQGNHQAVDKLVKHISPGLCRFAYRLCGDTQMAQEVVQEVWLKTLKTMRKLNDPRAFKSWVFKAVKWKAQDMLRQASRYEPLPEYLEQAVPGEQQKETRISHLIRHLPVSEQQIVYLFYMEELQLNEIAIVENIPIGTVKSRLSRARVKLKATLEKQDEFG